MVAALVVLGLAVVWVFWRQAHLSARISAANTWHEAKRAAQQEHIRWLEERLRLVTQKYPVDEPPAAQQLDERDE